MAQLLVTHIDQKHWYTPIASIRQYSEPDFENKLFKYSNDIFENYYVIKFKFSLSSSNTPGKKFEPDLLLISKTFKKWVIIEVELCKTPSLHTKNQLLCLSNPIFDPNSVTDFVIRQMNDLETNRSELIQMFSNISSDLLVIVDDYSDDVFSKFYQIIPDLKLCVLEVYKRPSYDFETYRFGGNYPYELSMNTKLKFYDYQHYQFLKTDIIKDLPEPNKEFEIFYNMYPTKAIIFNSKNTYYLKIPNNNIPPDTNLLIGIDISRKIVLQKI